MILIIDIIYIIFEKKISGGGRDPGTSPRKYATEYNTFKPRTGTGSSSLTPPLPPVMLAEEARWRLPGSKLT